MEHTTNRHGIPILKSRSPRLPAAKHPWRFRPDPHATKEARTAANKIFHRAKLKGQVEISPYCEKCGKEGVPLQFHHYNYKFPLRGVWVCLFCHDDIHGRNHHVDEETAEIPSRVNWRYRHLYPTGEDDAAESGSAPEQLDQPDESPPVRWRYVSRAAERNIEQPIDKPE